MMWDASCFPSTPCTSCGVARRPVRVVLTFLKGPNFFLGGGWPGEFSKRRITNPLKVKNETTRFRCLYLGTDTIPSGQRFLFLLCNEHRETDIKKINIGVGKASAGLAAWGPRGFEGPQRLQNSKLCCGFFLGLHFVLLLRDLGVTRLITIGRPIKSTGKGPPAGYLPHRE